MTRFTDCRRWMTLVLVGGLVACHWGTKATSFEPAMTPAGARVSLRIRGETVDRTGELYAVDTLGIILRETRLVRVRWQRLATMDVVKLGKGYDVSYDQQIVDAGQRARLAAVSRFPQGLTGTLLERVLVRMGQRAIEDTP